MKCLFCFFALLCLIVLTKADNKELCSLPPAGSETCRALFTRYYYNPATNKCEAFRYGGCQGNENNFKSIEECEKECKKE